MSVRAVIAVIAVAGCASPAPPPRPVRAPDRDPATAATPQPTRPSTPAPAPKPRLVVWLTVDQLRGDSFQRFGHFVSDLGFGYLVDHGLHFEQATYAHAITETAPGHATLFTGASPRDHGIVANEWMTPDGRVIASVTDPAAPLLGPELDESELTANAGRSPRSLLLPTFGDALRLATGGRSKVVSVSLKDRGAIFAAGHSGQAFWLGMQGFVTSRYYTTEAPPFLFEHHRRFPLEGYFEGEWPLLRSEAEYVSSASRPRVGARVEDFPHKRAPGTSAAAWLRATPMGDQAVIDLAERMCPAFGLGQDEFVDLLAISLSSMDYVGHDYGPDSREAEDTFVRLDALLSRFFDVLDERVGSERILYVLSSDHGISESPERQLHAGLPASRLTARALEEGARQSLREAFGSDRWLLGVAPPGIYLDRTAITKSGHHLGEVRAQLARGLSRLPGVYRAYAAGTPSDGSEIGERVAEAVLEGRSGDVYVVASPYFQISESETAAAHSSPWFSDRHVPIILRGPGVPPGRVEAPVDVRSLAGTVADLVGVPPPAGAYRGRLLSARPVPGRSD